jgi:cytochrome c556
MRGLVVGAGVVVVALTANAGCASMRRMDASEAIPARQKLMKEQLAAFQSASGKIKAGQIQAVAADANKLEETSKQIPRLFPENSVNPSTSRAKPEIWQKWSEFEGYAKALRTKAEQLEEAAKSGNAQATQAALAEVNRSACGACHTAFRGPEIKK